jgi:hypothetical protein
MKNVKIITQKLLPCKCFFNEVPTLHHNFFSMDFDNKPNHLCIISFLQVVTPLDSRDNRDYVFVFVHKRGRLRSVRDNSWMCGASDATLQQLALWRFIE